LTPLALYGCSGPADLQASGEAEPGLGRWEVDEMKKSQMVFVALVAMFAFGALTVESASAVTFLLALWLAKGVAVTEPLTAEVEGELTFEDTAAGAAVLCSVILSGWVGPESLGEISEVLELGTHNLISKTQLVEPGLACTNVKLL
jgi:hypothetical protein